MVGFVFDFAEEDCDEASKLKNSGDPFDPIGPAEKINGSDFSSLFDQSFLEFDPIKDWFDDVADLDRVVSGKVSFLGIEQFLDMVEEGCSVKAHVQDPIVIGSDPVLDGSGSVVKIKEELEDCSAPAGNGSDPVGNGSDPVGNDNKNRPDPVVDAIDPNSNGSSSVVKLGVQKGEEVGNLSCAIEEKMEKVSLEREADGLVVDDGNEAKHSEEKSREDERRRRSSSLESESESPSSSSSMSSSSGDSCSDDDDEEEEKEGEDGEKKGEVKREINNAVQMEEGEIRGEDVEDMVAWSDDDLFDGEDEGPGSVVSGPIKSKNELKVLPPVPPVDVTLQPHHQTLPVGVVLSVLGDQVIVEGVEKHNPLNEGTILWITERRSPLGLVDEIFGPVKNPYYVVRYNSENEVPAGIQEGTTISFVPEFANHVLNDNNLYKKGYDASGENDEEITDEAEFSDDEKEAEYKRSMKMTKRGLNDQKVGNRKKDGKKVKNKDGNWKKDQTSAPRASMGMGMLASDKKGYRVQPVAASLNHGNRPGSSGTAQVFTGGPGLFPPFSQSGHSAGLIPASSGIWTNGVPCQQQPSTVFPNGFPPSMQWLQHNNLQHLYQMPLPIGTPFQQQFDYGQRLPPNFVLPVGQPNFLAGPAYAPFPGFMGQNTFNPPAFGIGLQGQHTQGSQGVPSNGMQMDQNRTMQPPDSIPGNTENPRPFNPGASRGRGRKPFRRGGGHFAGGRNHH